MDKFLVFENLDGTTSDLHPTPFQYDVGEVITVNSTSPYKCVGVREDKAEKFIIQTFKEGEVSYNFDW